jgi:hypothetical protein
MNNEPVAYINKEDGLVCAKCFNPLYTHPAKTLTDGIDLLEKYADKLEDERPNKGLSDVVYECVAILRKAQE